MYRTNKKQQRLSRRNQQRIDFISSFLQLAIVCCIICLGDSLSTPFGDTTRNIATQVLQGTGPTAVDLNDYNLPLETIEKEPFVEWLTNNYKNFGCNLEFVTDRSSEGTQFVKGFGGIGGILRWKVDFTEMQNFEEAHEAYEAGKWFVAEDD